MSTAKKPPASRWIAALFSWAAGPGRPATVSALLTAAFVIGAYVAWVKYREYILNSPEFAVTPGQVAITPLPEWIHTDIREEVFRDPVLAGPLSLNDDSLTDRVAKAFAQCPWVAKVIRVTKRHPLSSDPASVKVELAYRTPVCMVQVAGGVLPVDADAILLPSDDFSPTEATRYARLEGVGRNPPGPPGTRWTDAKVIGGAEIAAVIGRAWTEWRLHRLVPLAAEPSEPGDNSGGRSRSAEPFFVLTTRAGSRILWGYAPGANVPGELSGTEKVARLRRYFADHDGFDGAHGQRQQLDVRKMRPDTAWSDRSREHVCLDSPAAFRLILENSHFQIGLGFVRPLF